MYCRRRASEEGFLVLAKVEGGMMLGGVACGNDGISVWVGELVVRCGCA